MIGKTISHYDILEKLGEGSMGKVYKAEDTKLKRIVALKFLPHHLVAGKTVKQRFLHEARSASALNHPNIITIHDIHEEDGEVFIAMECVDGELLSDKLKDGPLKQKELIDIASGIADGLNTAHNADITHRDIKSDNIIISKDGTAKILDFGLAKQKGMSQITQDGTTLGTQAYMSPEQVQSSKVDQRSDIFSFGVVMYQMATGKLPFEGEHDAAILYSIVNEAPIPTTTLNPNINDELQRIISKALEKNPKDRYQHADEILADLRKLKKGAAPKPTKAKAPIWRIPAYIISIILICILGYTVFLNNKDDDLKSIAVLAFEDLSQNKDQEYFSDGISEELINILTKIPNLRVISRTSAFSFKGKNETIEKIGKVLGVEHILEGSVRKNGDNIRITAQLIDVTDGSHIWSETYDKNLNDIFKIQDEIAEAVTNKLRITLLGNLSKTKEVDPEAYKFYLQANYLRQQRTEKALILAEEKILKSLEIDSTYAPFWYILSEINYLATYSFDTKPSEVGFSIAKKAILKAIKINPNYAQAYASLSALYILDWDFKNAQKYMNIALNLDSNNASILFVAASNASKLGKLETALSLDKQALLYDPLGYRAYYRISVDHLMLNQYQEALDAIKYFSEFNPGGSIQHTLTSWILLLLGRNDEALIESEKETDEWWKLYIKNFVAVSLGRKEEADSLLVEFLTHEKMSPSCIAHTYAFRGETDNAFEWLEKTYEQKDVDLLENVNYPTYQGLYDDPRWDTFITKIGLPEDHWLMKQRKK